jgi:hypothetical protein
MSTNHVIKALQETQRCLEIFEEQNKAMKDGLIKLSERIDKLEDFFDVMKRYFKQ